VLSVVRSPDFEDAVKLVNDHEIRQRGRDLHARR
jgi:hypothetical protein